MVRRSANALGATGDGSIDVLGVSANALASARNWRADFGPSPKDLSARIATKPLSVIGTSLSASAREIQVTVIGERGPLELAAVVERTDGNWHELVLKPDNQGRLVTTIDPTDRGGRFLGLRIGVNGWTAQQIEHKIGEGNTFVDAESKSLLLQSIAAIHDDSSSTPIAFERSLLQSDQAALKGTDKGLEIQVAIQGTSVLVLPSSNREPIPALVDSATAALAGGIGKTLFVETLKHRIAFRVTAVATRFPTVGGRFAIADLEPVRREFNIAQPGFGTPTEAWVSARRDGTGTLGRQTKSIAAGPTAMVATALTTAPLNQLLTSRRSTIESQLRSDPLRRMSTAVLAAAAGLALLIAMIGLVLSARSEVSDQEQFRRALLLDGVIDRRMQRVIGWRTVLGAIIAIPLGVVAGLVVLRLTASDIGAGAENTLTTLPLRFVVAWIPASLTVLGAAIAFGVAAHLGARAVPEIPPAELLRGRPQ